jgi:hypothetical protein
MNPLSFFRVGVILVVGVAGRFIGLLLLVTSYLLKHTFNICSVC